jgi:hypothetical protein
MNPWRSRSKAESVSYGYFRIVPYWGGPDYNVPMERLEPEPRAAQVSGGWVGLGHYLPWSHQTELIDRHRRVTRVILPGDWP